MKKSFTNYPNCHSGSRLDEFVARLFNFKRSGTYVDIGSAHAMHHNNSYFLDVHLDWDGICVEMDPSWNETYQCRKHCQHINGDATKVDYKQVFTDKGLPSSIDYLSLDVDVLDLEVIKMLPTDYRFKVIGIEHDAYLHGDLYRAPQREFLLGAGYSLVCSDVLVRNANFENCPFEDWYLDPACFGGDIINKLTCNGSYPEDILNRGWGTNYTCYSY
jgi:hypothetical protein